MLKTTDRTAKRPIVKTIVQAEVDVHSILDRLSAEDYIHLVEWMDSNIGDINFTMSLVETVLSMLPGLIRDASDAGILDDLILNVGCEKIKLVELDRLVGK